MAEFKEVCRQWRRMCDANSKCDGGCVDLCALAHNSFCGVLTEASDADIAKAENAIMEFAAENPEPVYPTWGEWLYSVGVLTDKELPMPTINDDAAKIICPNIATDKANDPIPAEIAEKLGIAPKVIEQ